MTTEDATSQAESQAESPEVSSAIIRRRAWRTIAIAVSGLLLLFSQISNPTEGDHRVALHKAARSHWYSTSGFLGPAAEFNKALDNGDLFRKFEFDDHKAFMKSHPPDRKELQAVLEKQGQRAKQLLDEMDQSSEPPDDVGSDRSRADKQRSRAEQIGRVLVAHDEAEAEIPSSPTHGQIEQYSEYVASGKSAQRYGRHVLDTWRDLSKFDERQHVVHRHSLFICSYATVDGPAGRYTSFGMFFCVFVL